MNRDVTNQDVLASYGKTFKYSNVKTLDLTQLSMWELSELKRFCIEECPKGYVIMMLRVKNEKADRPKRGLKWHYHLAKIQERQKLEWLITGA